MQDIDIPYYIWNRFNPNCFYVAEELVGTVHKFEFKNTHIVLRFPEISEFKEMDSDAKLTSWQNEGVVGGEMKPSFYSVNCLYINIDNDQSVNLNSEVTKNNPNCYEYVPELKQKELYLIAQKGKEKANIFYSHFSRVVRWVMSDHRICRSQVVDQRTNWHPRIFSKDTDKTIWIGGKNIFVVGVEPVINMNDWEKISQTLNADTSLPIYVQLLDDAMYQLSVGDQKRFVSDLAVAAETYVRNIVSSTLPEELPTPYVSILDEYNIRPILTKVLPGVFSEEENAKLKKIISGLHGLFDKRNDLFHFGKIDDLNQEKCKKYLKSVKDLINIRGV